MSKKQVKQPEKEAPETAEKQGSGAEVPTILEESIDDKHLVLGEYVARTRFINHRRGGK